MMKVKMPETHKNLTQLVLLPQTSSNETATNAPVSFEEQVERKFNRQLNTIKTVLRQLFVFIMACCWKHSFLQKPELYEPLPLYSWSS